MKLQTQLIGLDNLADRVRVRRDSEHRLHVGEADSRQVGRDHLRLLLGRLRHRDRRQGRQSGRHPALTPPIR